MSYQDAIEKVIEDQSSSLAGLTNKEAQKKLAEHGPNLIQGSKNFSALKKFLLGFTDFLALMLIAASALSFATGSNTEGIVIIGIVILNAVISFFQEYKAEKAIQALQKMVPQKATVVRNNLREVIDVSEIVPGDIIILEEGTKVPADIRLIKANDFFTNDFALTGESDPQEKFAGVIEKPNLSLTEIDNMVFMGMSVSSGNATGIVVATGMDTEFGKIANLTTTTKTDLSPLQIEIADIGRKVSKLIFVVAFVIAIVGIFLKYDLLENIKFTIGVAAALVPEGLPATISVALAIAVQKMARKKAIIKKLSAVETMGCTNVIATDKTGTLTKNEMTVKKIYLSGQEIHVEGNGYQAKGNLTICGHKLPQAELKKMNLFFDACVLCNNAHLKNHAKNREVIGDITEGALVVLGEKAGLKKAAAETDHPKIFEIAFTSERKRMSTVHSYGSGYAVFTKGAPLEMLGLCDKILHNGRIKALTAEEKKKIIAQNDLYAQDAMRVLALAYKPIKKAEKYSEKEVESDLVFLGIVAIIDPPREEVPKAVAIAKAAGIRIYMVTGDYSLTAQAIAKKIGLGENLPVITGSELNSLSDGEISHVLRENESAIFSRVAPEHKMRITKILQKSKQIVAVTGDGVNDAPALKKANVGVAMGITGTDVSKEAAEMVLADDSFASIIAAIKEGRVIYDNMKKFIKYVFSHNFSELFAVVLSIPLGVSAITPIQIFIIDLGSDILPSLALSVDPEDPSIMSRKPRDQRAKLFNSKRIRDMVFVGFFAAIFAVIAFGFVLLKGGWQWGDVLNSSDALYRQATTATFTGIVLAQFFNSFYCRSPHRSLLGSFLENKKLVYANAFSLIFLLNVIYNPILNKLFATAPLEGLDWFIILTGVTGFALILEVYKKIVHGPVAASAPEPEAIAAAKQS